MHDQLLVEKCIDKKAKFDFTLKFVQLDGDKGKKDQNGVSHR